VQLRRRTAVALAVAGEPVAAAELARRLNTETPAVARALAALQRIGLARTVGENRRLARWQISGPLANGEDDHGDGRHPDA
jgi:hypothetical protein